MNRIYSILLYTQTSYVIKNVNKKIFNEVLWKYAVADKSGLLFCTKQKA